MPVPFSSLTPKADLEKAVSDGGAADGQVGAVNTEAVTRGDHDSRGRFATGNRAQTSNKGIVSLIKSKTRDYETLIDNLLTVSRGQELYKKKPNLKDILDATNSLLDRSIGKPTQQVLHTGDDIAKELLATRQEALRLQKAEAARRAEEREAAPDVVAEGKVSSLQAMRDKVG